MAEKITFSFGKNWQKFLDTINDDSIKEAEKSLTDFMDMTTFKGKTFLDVGCGSGLFSYSAYRLAAKKIVSFDLDPFSVKCCEWFHDKSQNPKHWQIREGSVLDTNFITKLGMFDIVYAWGVLHHTGNMWKAVSNAASRVNRDGYYYLALYNNTKGLFGSKFWLKIKKIYNASPKIGKFILEYLYSALFFSSMLLKFKNPFSFVREFYRSNKGMRWNPNVADWLGGYPYEYASVDEVVKFMHLNFPDLYLINIWTTSGTGNNKFLFHRAR